MKTIMKQVLPLFLALALVFNGPAQASPESDKIIKDFAEEFVKDQLKKELEQFLNSKSEFLGVTTNTFGTQMMQYVGYALAVYGFISADTDKQRLYSAASVGVMFSPEPYSAMALMVIQMIDMSISMSYEMKLAKIYYEIAQIRRQTVLILRQVYEDDFEEQKRIIEAIDQISSEIVRYHSELQKHPVILFLSDQSDQVPSQEQITDALMKINELNQLFLDYDMIRMTFDAFVKVDTLEYFETVKSGLDEFEKNIEPVKTSISKSIETVRELFATVKSNKQISELSKKSLEKRNRLEKYLYCSQAVNRWFSGQLLSEVTTGPVADSFELELVEECQKSFQWKVAK